MSARRKAALFLVGCAVVGGLGGCGKKAPAPAPTPSATSTALQDGWVVPAGAVLRGSVGESSSGSVKGWSATLSLGGRSEEVSQSVRDQASALGWRVEEEDVAGSVRDHRLVARTGAKTLYVDVISVEGQPPYVRFLEVG